MVIILGRSVYRLAAQSRLCRSISVSMIRRAQIKKVLCVAEKNDAAKGIAEIMSNGRSRRVSVDQCTDHQWYIMITKPWCL